MMDGIKQRFQQSRLEYAGRVTLPWGRSVVTNNHELKRDMGTPPVGDGSPRAQARLRLKQRLLRMVGEKGKSVRRYSHSELLFL